MHPPAGSEAPVDVALAVVLRRGAVLLQRRAGPPFEGRWELPGGKVRPGEGPAEAAAREAAEELGAPAEAGAILGVREHRYPGGPWVRLHAVEVTLRGEPAASPGLAWVPLGEVAGRDVLEGTLPLLALLAPR